ncbi:hypothetical protein MTR67_016810 [Solanum verrucosum]|uniref:Uncharacterized protein n=1 Tax=Solanum verrucosum TaxID=315347 RepID=A0AAF0TRN7_SOLVR|nr:hypothetical protein MTR67_016810 [Solanum verrucosum]
MEREALALADSGIMPVSKNEEPGFIARQSSNSLSLHPYKKRKSSNKDPSKVLIEEQNLMMQMLPDTERRLDYWSEVGNSLKSWFAEQTTTKSLLEMSMQHRNNKQIEFLMQHHYCSLTGNGTDGT